MPPRRVLDHKGFPYRTAPPITDHCPPPSALLAGGATGSLATVDHLKRARAVFDIELAGLKAVRDRLDSAFERAVEVVVRALLQRGKVVVVGIGKTGNIGRKITATLTSTGSASVVLHSVDALHGDLIVINRRHEPVGLVDSQDLPKFKLM